MIIWPRLMCFGRRKEGRRGCRKGLFLPSPRAVFALLAPSPRRSSKSSRSGEDSKLQVFLGIFFIHWMGNTRRLS